MNGPAHWREADLILTGDADPCSYGCPHSGCPHEMSMLTRAFGHGLLALAAAVVDGPAVMRPEDRDEWDRATGRLEDDRAEEEWAREGMETAMSASERAEYDEMSEAYLDAAEEARDRADDGDDYRGWLP